MSMISFSMDTRIVNNIKESGNFKICWSKDSGGYELKFWFANGNKFYLNLDEDSIKRMQELMSDARHLVNNWPKR